MAYNQKIRQKVVDLQTLLSWVNIWKGEGKKIVFTNGCFDIIHAGHIDYLSKAADLGDKLIIGLNTDSSVSKIKGEHRPIQNEYSRSLVISAFEFTDAVVFFDDDTPIDLIEKIIPDILVKGSDYKAEDIVGFSVVTQHGGRVETIDFLDGYSTSSIEKKIIDDHCKHL